MEERRKALALRKETLTELGDADLAAVVGGMMTTLTGLECVVAAVRQDVLSFLQCGTSTGIPQ